VNNNSSRPPLSNGIEPSTKQEEEEEEEEEDVGVMERNTDNSQYVMTSWWREMRTAVDQQLGVIWKELKGPTFIGYYFYYPNIFKYHSLSLYY